MRSTLVLLLLILTVLSQAQFSTCPAADALQIAQSSLFVTQIHSQSPKVEIFRCNKESIFSATTSPSPQFLTALQVWP